MPSMPTCEVRPRKDKRGVDLISYAVPSARLCFTGSRWNGCTFVPGWMYVFWCNSFDCRMVDDPATIKDRINENNTDVVRWVDARRLRINGKPCSKPRRCVNLRGA